MCYLCLRIVPGGRWPTLAMDALGNGDRSAAAHYFRECLEIDGFRYELALRLRGAPVPLAKKSVRWVLPYDSRPESLIRDR